MFLGGSSSTNYIGQQLSWRIPEINGRIWHIDDPKGEGFFGPAGGGNGIGGGSGGGSMGVTLSNLPTYNGHNNGSLLYPNNYRCNFWMKVK